MDTLYDLPATDRYLFHLRGHMKPSRRSAIRNSRFRPQIVSIAVAAGIAALTPAAMAVQPVLSPLQSGRGGIYLLIGEIGHPVANGGIAVNSTPSSAVLFGVGRPTVTLRSPVQTDQSISVDVNSSGVAVGLSKQPFTGGIPKSWGESPLVWDTAGTPTLLPLLGITSSQGGGGRALAINEAGTIVGGSTLNDVNSLYPVRWTAGSLSATLLNNPDGKAGTATLINNAGVVVGFSVGSLPAGGSPPYLAVRWEPGATTGAFLPSLGGGLGTTAQAINEAGTIVGSAAAPAGTPGGSGTRAVRWNATTNAITVLDALDTDASGGTSAVAYDVNDAGTAVGSSTFHPTPTTLVNRPTRWLAGSTDVETLAFPADTNATTGYAIAVNESGIAVGTVAGPNGSRAVAWMPDGTAISLNSLIAPGSSWSLNVAQGISDDNWVTGYGTFDPDGPGGSPGSAAAFLIQVPEPTSVLVLAATSLMLRRRSR